MATDPLISYNRKKKRSEATIEMSVRVRVECEQILCN